MSDLACGLQHTRLFWPHYLLKFAWIHLHWVGDAIWPSHPLLRLSPFASIFPSIRVFFSGQPSHQVAKVLELQQQSFQWILRIDFLQDWLVWSSFSSRDSQESSPTQFKSINSLTLNFLYSPTLTSINDYWRNYSFDYTDLCRQSNVCAMDLWSCTVCYVIFENLYPSGMYRR